MDDAYIGDVLELVAAIPPGRVMAYSDIAREVGGGPRQVGSVMSHWGSDVPWWRVVRADGRPAEGLEERAFAHYAKEKTPLRPDGERVDMREARWEPTSPRS